MSGRGARISGGAYGRRTLRVPPGVRPTEGRVREALASIWGESIEGARCLDLFAGSGAVSLELCGRGARSVIAIEGDRRTTQRLRALAEDWAVSNLDVREAELPGGLRAALAGAQSFDRVFADPPYAFVRYPELIAEVGPFLATEGEFVLELSARVDAGPLHQASPELECWDQRRYGEIGLLRFRRLRSG
jgi:16S rRNA (guanine966-N2)-methyltransferase